MLKTFIPRYGRIEVEPIKGNTFLVSEDKNYIEKGKIIAIGDTVSANPEYKIGDVIYFEAYGIFTTPKEDGECHYVLRGVEYIMGKDGE